MQPSDWNSFDAAAARVRVLSWPMYWDDAKIYKFHSNVLKSLACAAKGRTGSLLPRLQQLTWDTSCDEYPYLSLFLTPTLTNLTVCISTGPGNIESDIMRCSVLGSLVSQCPSVRSLELWAMGSNSAQSWTDLFSEQPSNASTLFSVWTGLDSLCFRQMDLSTLTDVIAQLPVLTKLELYGCRTTIPLLSTSVTGFPTLRHLIMHYCSLDSCLHILKRMSCSPLSSLNLRVAAPDPNNVSLWTDLISNLQKSISRDSLVAVSFSIDHVSWLLQPIVPLLHFRNPPIPLTFQSIFPLLHFRNISQFDYNGRSILDLADDDVMRIVKAWPHLKLFVIRSWLPAKPRLTLHALTTLAMHCPELEVLAISIDATAVIDYEDPGKGRFESRLRQLDVYRSPIDDPGRVAAFITVIFPNVKEISVARRVKKNCKAWKEVERLLATSRRQEVNHES